MAIAVVNKKQTGSAAAESLAITKPTKGNLLVVFIAQTGSEVAPTMFGFTVLATSAQTTLSTARVFAAAKLAGGLETVLSATAGTGGAIQGISYVELSGTSATAGNPIEESIDVIVASNGNAKAKTATTEPVTTATAGDAVLTGWVRGAAASGVIEAWTGEGPLENVETASTRCFAGVKVFAGALTAATFTANWTTETVSGMLTVAITPASAEVTFKASPTVTLTAKDTLVGAQRLATPITARFVPQDTLTAAQKLAASISSKQTLSVSAVGNQRLLASATSSMTIRDTPRVTQTLSAALDERVTLGDALSAAQTTAAKLAEDLELKDSVTATFASGQKLEPRPTVKDSLAAALKGTQALEAKLTDRVVLGDRLTPAQAQALTLHSQVKFQTTLQAVIAGSEHHHGQITVANNKQATIKLTGGAQATVKLASRAQAHITIASS